jgi:APA family basic amino acid/polyamine antiporter
VLCVSGKFGDLLTYATFASLLFYFNDLWGIYIKKREPNAERPYRAFGYPFVALYIIVTTAICIIIIRHFKYRFGTGL